MGVWKITSEKTKSPLASNYLDLHKEIESIELYVDFDLSNWKNEDTNGIMALFHNLRANGWRVRLSNDAETLCDHINSITSVHGDSKKIAVVSFNQDSENPLQQIKDYDNVISCYVLDKLEADKEQYGIPKTRSLTDRFNEQEIHINDINKISVAFLDMIYSSVTGQ